MDDMNAQKISRQLKVLGNKDQAAVSRRFFKTGPGEYGEGDRFLGIKVPALRKLVKEFAELSLPEVTQLLKSEIHYDAAVRH